MSGSSEIVSLPPGANVLHQARGRGVVIAGDGATVVVRFGPEIHEVPRRELEILQTLAEAAASSPWHSPLEVITRAQAAAIRSIHDVWGVFSMSRIKLLPHQLWVCKQVAASWPTRWLIADDVGLGKTIEAGLIISALQSRGVAKRVLIMCPASLQEQWSYRLRRMFDLRSILHSDQVDTPRSDFWNTQDFVIASLQTLRMNDDERQPRQSQRYKRLMEADAWDLVIVDEAHHLNFTEEAGPTLGYRLLKDLVDNRRAHSLLFFTGTPHRGKDVGFYALLRLLRPDLFDLKKSVKEQVPFLRQVLIRNNKQNVTDLTGEKLFQAPAVVSETYVYSPEEAAFYDMLTDFILTGKAYANSRSLTQADRRMVGLVLIALQKLASSSVAAIRRALKRRLDRSGSTDGGLAITYSNAQDLGEGDQIGGVEETLGAARWLLMEDERDRLQELLSAADRVTQETKIRKILETVRERFTDQAVLFFTEYKATQSLLMSYLIQEYGDDCVGFINGDNRAEEVVDRGGRVRTLVAKREDTADRFNEGRIRFLVSTEAGGEGIDLQDNCHCLIHVDLPWNPMRLHQRVGRLNRYGQKRQVEVISLRNPLTVESQIWDKLNNKIAAIMRSVGIAMDEPEDLLQLVLGMTSPSMFEELFSEAVNVKREGLADWFDGKTSQFGGQDALDTVRNLVGNASSFDFESVSSKIPNVDLPDLRPFFETMVELGSRRPQRDADGSLRFRTPLEWLDQFGIDRDYEGMLFKRGVSSKEIHKVVGVGHPLMELALERSLKAAGTIASVPRSALAKPLVVVRISERTTGQSGVVTAIVVGVELSDVEPFDGVILKDWELLLTLNRVCEAHKGRGKDSPPAVTAAVISRALDAAVARVKESLGQMAVSFQYPNTEELVVLWPQGSIGRL